MVTGDDELLSVEDKDVFAAALSDKPPAEKPDAEPAPEPKDDRPRDEQGRFVAKAPDAETTTAEPVAKSLPGEKPPSDEGLSSADAIPSWRLREETQRRREVEERLAAREAEMRQLLYERQQRQRQQQPPEQMPDLIEQPEEFQRALLRQQQQFRAELFQQFEQREIARSLHRADRTHGEKFKQAYEEFNSPARAGDAHLLARVRNSVDPGEEILTWYREQQSLSEIGPDPAAYRAKIEAETRAKLLADAAFRKEAIESWRAEATTRPSSVASLPNLSRTPGSSVMSDERLPVTDAEIFADAARRRA